MISSLQIDFSQYYDSHISKLTNISYDDANGVSICESDEEFFNYDSIVRSVCKNDDILCSPDLIGFTEDEVVFVEFKNGSLDKSTHKKELKLKAIEGGYLALYKAIRKFNETISFEDIMKIKKSYCVVYNIEKSKPSRTAAITGHLSYSHIRFGLEKYKSTFFNNIHTISPKIFMEKVLPKIQPCSSIESE